MLSKTQLDDLQAELFRRKAQIAHLENLETRLNVYAKGRGSLALGSEFAVDVSYRHEDDGESLITVTTPDGHTLGSARDGACPERLQLGEAIRRAVVKALEAQIIAITEDHDQLLCEILNKPLPQEETERAPRGIRMRALLDTPE